MIKYLLSILILGVLVVSCTSQQTESKPQPKILPDSKSHELSLQDQPAKTVIDYFKWYDHHRDSMLQYPLVDTSLKVKKYFFLDRENVQRLLDHVKSSGFVNPCYLGQLEEYFSKELKYLEWLHEYDEIPYEYDVDPVIRYMDYEHVVNGLDDSVLDDLWMNGPEARVNIGWVNGTKIKAFLSFDQEKWMIDSIEYGPTNYR